VRVGPSLVVVDVEARGDAELELWGARRKRDLFERLFGRDLEFVLSRRQEHADAP
jgi:exopolyphosphatase/guanosine-5'-triphosphate,3'-diphosphate pyrophosphatase